MLDFFKDDKGNLSSMRLSCFICLIVAIVLTFYGIIKSIDTYTFVLTYLSVAFGGKVIQKGIETGIVNNSTPIDTIPTIEIK